MTYDEALVALNSVYAELKCGPDVYFKAPELRPEIRSNQVKALVQLLVSRGIL